jgi:hypothetical protein
MSKLNAAVLALCMFAAGVLGGLAFAAINRGSLGEMTEERDRLVAENEKLQAEVDGLTPQLAEAISAQQDLTEKLRRTTEVHVKTTEHLVKSQAVLGMLLKVPEVRPFLLGDQFRRSFKADWWFPETAFKLIGGRWFVEELAEQKLIDKEAVAKTSEESTWKTVATWTVRGAKSTESFETISPVWRVSWKLRGRVAIYVKNVDGKVVQTMMGEGADSSFVRVPPGSFYLEVNTVGTEATITVEEPI